jgi:hypothetical protein
MSRKPHKRGGEDNNEQESAGGDTVKRERIEHEECGEAKRSGTNMINDGGCPPLGALTSSNRLAIRQIY